MRRLALVGLAGLVLACGGGGEGPAQTSSPKGQEDASPPRALAPEGPAWGAVSRLTGQEARDAGLVRAELARQPKSEAIAIALSSGDAAMVDRAALSMGRIGGTPAAEAFSDWLGDGSRTISPAVAGAVALLVPPPDAPGEPPEPEGVWATLEQDLWTRYAVADDAALAEALLLAIARVGGRTSIRNLAIDLEEPPPPEEYGRFERGTEALAILCVRGHALSAKAIESIGDGLASKAVPLRRGSAYALSRCAGPSAERLAGSERGTLIERLSAMVASSEPGEALAAWRALEALGEPPASIPPSVLGREPPGWQEEVAAVRALGASAVGRKELAQRLAGLTPWDVEGPRIHALIEGLRAMRRATEGSPELLASLSPLADRVAGGLAGITDARRKKATALMHCELTVLAALRTGQLDAVRTCADGVPGLPAHYGPVLAVDALLAGGPSLSGESRIDQILAAAASDDRAVAEVALAGLAEIDDDRVNALLRSAMSSDDVGLASAAAGAIGARAVDQSKRDPDAVPALQGALARLTNDAAVEARIEVVRALGALARSSGAKDEGPPAPAAWLADIEALATDSNQAVRDAARAALSAWDDRVTAFDAAAAKKPAAGFSQRVHDAATQGADATGLVLHTSAGDVTIEFAGAPAPIAQASLAVLASNGYFDGLTFHRVVPAFVVQGGDPRGDGYGGPGYVMPCEWSNLRYERGTVGIALAGKDTGGSQIFISHGAPHHLDGRYPVIGRVTEGMDVVDSLLPHDAIESVEVRK